MSDEGRESGEREEERTERGICPLLRGGWCLGEGCAWWLSGSNSCAVWVLGVHRWKQILAHRLEGGEEAH